MPPGSEGAKHLLTTSSFRISQSVDPKPDDLKIGDAITRTVTMTAEDTVGISLPPLKFEAPEGVRLYPGVPQVTEMAERGRLEATRTETASYVLEKAGHYSLPGITVLWWNPQTETMNTASLPSIELKVQSSSSYDPELFASSQAEEGRSAEAGVGLRNRLRATVRWALLPAAAFLLFLVFRRLLGLKGVSLSSYLAERHRRKAAAESTHFKQFRKASLSGDPQAALRQLMRWLDCANTEPSAPTLRQFVTNSSMPELADATRALNNLLFARQMDTQPVPTRRKWSGKRLYRLVAKARRLQKGRSTRQPRGASLMHNIN